jgi:hypothetical protein
MVGILLSNHMLQPALDAVKIVECLFAQTAANPSIALIVLKRQIPLNNDVQALLIVHMNHERAHLILRYSSKTSMQSLIQS